MNIKDFSALLKAKAAELNDFRHRKLPVLVGRTAKDHFQENFRQGGFVDGSLHPWQEAQRRKKGGKRASTKYGTLLSGRNHLFSSIKYIPGDSSVTVTNDVEYAALHNNGPQAGVLAYLTCILTKSFQIVTRNTGNRTKVRHGLSKVHSSLRQITQHTAQPFSDSQKCIQVGHLQSAANISKAVGTGRCLNRRLVYGVKLLPDVIQRSRNIIFQVKYDVK